MIFFSSFFLQSLTMHTFFLDRTNANVKLTAEYPLFLLLLLVDLLAKVHFCQKCTHTHTHTRTMFQEFLSTHSKEMQFMAFNEVIENKIYKLIC